MINSVDRAVDILFCLYKNGAEMGISEISRELGIYKSTVHRTLATLEARGLVYQNADNNKYWLGVKIYAMGLLAGKRFSPADILKPYTEKLYEQVREVINVSILDKHAAEGLRSIVVHKETDGKKVLSVNPQVGASNDCHCSAVGKCLLAFDHNVDLTRFTGLPLKKYTKYTIDNWPDLLDELERVRRRGYAVDQDEQEIGLTCIGAPVFGRDGDVAAAVSISGPSQRMKDGGLDGKIELLRAAAREMSGIL